MINNSEPFSDEVAGPDSMHYPAETDPVHEAPALDGELLEPEPTVEKIDVDATLGSCTVIGRLEPRSRTAAEIVEDTPSYTCRLRLGRTIVVIKVETRR